MGTGGRLAVPSEVEHVQTLSQDLRRATPADIH